MKTKEEIDQHYLLKHDALTEQYYADPQGFPGGKASFDWLHGENWHDHENELIKEGYLHEPASLSLDERLSIVEFDQNVLLTRIENLEEKIG